MLTCRWSKLCYKMPDVSNIYFETCWNIEHDRNRYLMSLCPCFVNYTGKLARWAGSANKNWTSQCLFDRNVHFRTLSHCVRSLLALILRVPAIHPLQWEKSTIKSRAVSKSCEVNFSSQTPLTAMETKSNGGEVASNTPTCWWQTTLICKRPSWANRAVILPIR